MMTFFNFVTLLIISDSFTTLEAKLLSAIYKQIGRGICTL